MVRSGFILGFYLLGMYVGLCQIKCKISTGLGEIVIELDSAAAPKTTANFLYYVSHGLYDSTTFFRVCTPENESKRQVRIEVIQGGKVAEKQEARPVEFESTKLTGLKHIAGTISMARNGPQTATSQFFICVTDEPELDFEGSRNPDGQGFAAFGRVISGMEVVKRIQRLPEKEQMLLQPVLIISVIRI